MEDCFCFLEICSKQTINGYLLVTDTEGFHDFLIKIL